MAFRSGFARMSARRWVIFFEATTRSACVRDELNTSTGSAKSRGRRSCVSQLVARALHPEISVRAEPLPKKCAQENQSCDDVVDGDTVDDGWR